MGRRQRRRSGKRIKIGTVEAPRQFVLSGFEMQRPQFQATQQEGFAWLAAAHDRAQATGEGGAEDRQARYRKLFARFGCPAEKIAFRGFESGDFLHTAWEKMRIYRLHETAAGEGTATRFEFFKECVEAAFERFYPPDAVAPADLVHVTCTGYLSPSAAQRLADKRNWPRTRVSHAYHMGCYAAMPAIRMAAGFLASPRAFGGALDTEPRVDIVHSELCTLYLDPSNHSPEQMVVQSLFADGYIKYSLRAGGSGLAVLALQEELVPDSAQAMTWSVNDRGFHMTLSRDVPARIAEHLQDFLCRLFHRAGRDFQQEREHATFAIHPGGPKIIDLVAEKLGLREPQIQFSREVLRDYGNMSSATLPHVWQRMAESPAVEDSRLIASLAFGPGLTISGALFEKRSA